MKAPTWPVFGNVPLRALGMMAAAAGVTLVGAAADAAVSATVNPDAPQSLRELRAVVRSFETAFNYTASDHDFLRGGYSNFQNYQRAVGIPLTGAGSNLSATGSVFSTNVPYSLVQQPVPFARRGPRMPLRSAGNSLSLPTLSSPFGGSEVLDRGNSRGVFDHFADEPFLAQLEVRLRRAELGGDLLHDVEEYLVERERLIGEIASAIVRGKTDSAAISSCAAQQKERLAKLEVTGEDLRRRLARGNLIVGNAYNLLENRDWRFNAAEVGDPNYHDAHREAVLLRLSAYFAEGFSPAQRRLLREAAADLTQDDNVRRATETSVVPRLRSDSAAEVFRFLPEQSEVMLPAQLSQSLRAEIDAFTRLKRDLKKELRDAVYFNDRRSDSERREIFSRLAAKQEPQIAELEARSESLRTQLAPMLGAAAVEGATTLSPALTARIADYRAAKSGLQTQMQRRLKEAAVRRGEPPLVLRLYTGASPLQTTAGLETLALFEGRHAAELQKLGSGGSPELDRDLAGQLRRALASVWPKDSGEAPRFRYACDTKATSTEQRQRAREQFAAVWERRRDLTAPLVEEAARLQREMTGAGTEGVVQLLAELQAHWLQVNRVAHALSLELGLVAPAESKEEWMHRRSEVAESVSREQRAELDRLEREEKAIRAELARLPGGGAAAGRDFDALLAENQIRLRAAESLLAIGTYRTAVLAPGLSAAQRRLLLSAAVVEVRRWRAPDAEDNGSAR